MTENLRTNNNCQSSTASLQADLSLKNRDSASYRTVTRKDLGNAIGDRYELTRSDALTILSAVLTTMSEAIVRGERVKISNFGIFHTHHKKTRIGRNPNTMEEAIISARAVVLFKASPKLRHAVNKRNGEQS